MKKKGLTEVLVRVILWQSRRCGQSAWGKAHEPP